MRIKFRLKHALLSAVSVFLILFCVWFWYVFVGGNFFTVLDGELYRSAQPAPEVIEQKHEKYGIKTIINLRGARPNKQWYKEELAVSERLGIAHYDFQWSSRNQPPVDDMKRFVETVRNAPKPILIHCMGGSDRTGLATALYMYAVKNENPDKSREENLSLWYGHFPYLGIKSGAMEDAFNVYSGITPQN